MSDSDDSGQDRNGFFSGRLPWHVVLPLATALVLGLGALHVLGLAARPLALLILAITVAEALSPLVDRLEPYLWKRTLAVLVVYVLLTLVIGLLAWFMGPRIGEQLGELGRRAPDIVSDIHARLTRIGPISDQDITGLTDSLRQKMQDLALTAPRMLFGALIDVLLVVFLSIYWLVTAGSIKKFALSLVPPDRRDKASAVLEHMGSSMGGYFRGAVIDAAAMGLLAYVGLLIVGVPYPIALGVLTMLGEIIPVVGPVLVGVIVAGIALLQSVTKALIALALYTALQQIEGHVLAPNVMRSQTDIPQTLVLFAIVVGALGGILGILVAIPVAAALRVLVVDVIARAERKAVDAEPEPAG